ncbi:nitroreductase/quinone reductase family protein [Kribbella speibonae]|uniref:Nitroreductase family deazaflavin-dependent oxidoreductase n=1 Tax=Kribbella speibonae TaxID=1572660 RepID=A0A4R0IVP3_9ACTN|nr:nitroreductase/quinone reductase family protein [Kribbella speibonae]TCC35588.1 nitroreductase family deazaflavin-dependent oxidoreductase [Kribbella speibonae]
MLLELTTIGARSGATRTVTVAYAEIDGRLLVFASNAGRPQAPAWLHNLRANPLVTVELDGRRYDAIAEEVVGAERDRLYGVQAERDAAFATYQQNTSRVIAVVALTPARVGAATAQLKEIHNGLREQLSATLAAVDAYLAGSAPAPHAKTLHQHCLSFCSALHAHHSREDGVFPRLAANFPELKPTLDRLSHEHAAVAELNQQLTTTIEQLTDSTPPEAELLRAHLTHLAETLEAHYTYEEAHLGPALDAA